MRATIVAILALLLGVGAGHAGEPEAPEKLNARELGGIRQAATAVLVARESAQEDPRVGALRQDVRALREAVADYRKQLVGAGLAGAGAAAGGGQGAAAARSQATPAATPALESAKQGLLGRLAEARSGAQALRAAAPEGSARGLVTQGAGAGPEASAASRVAPPPRAASRVETLCSEIEGVLQETSPSPGALRDLEERLELRPLIRAPRDPGTPTLSSGGPLQAP